MNFELINHVFSGELKKIGKEKKISSYYKPLWVGVWPVFNSGYNVIGDSVQLTYEGMLWHTIPKKIVDFCVGGYRQHGFLWVITRMEIATFMPVTVLCDFREELRHILPGRDEREASGQMKMLANYLDTVQCPLEEMKKAHVVVIGSGGPPTGVAGATYEIVKEEVKKIEGYEPHEVSSVEGNLEIIGDFFSYDSQVRPEVTHVIDDSYVEENTIDEHPILDVIDKISIGYAGKYVAVKVESPPYIDKGVYKTSRSVYELIESPGDHSKMAYLNPIGGGVIDKKGPQVVCGSYSSMGYPPSRSIKKAFPAWLVADPVRLANREQYFNLRRIFPNAVISMKGLCLRAATYPGAEIRDQKFYDGKEKRVFFSHRPLQRYDTQCGVCGYLSHPLGKKIEKYFIAIGGLSCTKCDTRKKDFMKHDVLNLARKWVHLDFAVKYMKTRHQVTEDSIRSYISLMAMRKEIKLFQDRISPIKAVSYFVTPRDVGQTGMELIISSSFKVSEIRGDIVKDFAREGPIMYIGEEYVEYPIVILKNYAPHILPRYELTHNIVSCQGFFYMLKKNLPPPCDLEPAMKLYSYFFSRSRFSLEGVEPPLAWFIYDFLGTSRTLSIDFEKKVLSVPHLDLGKATPKWRDAEIRDKKRFMDISTAHGFSYEVVPIEQ